MAGPRLVALSSRLDAWSFVQGFALDGIFVIGLSVLAARAMPDGAVLAAGAALALRYVAELALSPPGAALALRYVAELALSPPGGALAERVGAMPLLVALSLGSAAGLAAVGLGVLWPGAVAVVVLRGLLQPLPAPVVAAAHPGPERVPALARLATWRDLGAGLGPLAAGALLPVLAPATLYGATALGLALASLACAGQRRRQCGR